MNPFREADMSASTLAPVDPTQLPEGPPEEEFWDRYNKRLEFPLSTIATVLRVWRAWRMR